MIPRPEVIKLLSCSTQLTMKFFLFINVKMPTIVGILISILPKNQAAAIEMVISDFFRILKTFIAFVSLCHKSPKAKGKP